jgi:AcrR family transcriptional regulator
MSPRRAEQNEALRSETRSKIMEAALLLFGERGYESTTIKQIAEHARIAQGLMYRHFASKEQLLAAIFSESITDVRESFAQAEESGPPAAHLLGLIRAALAGIQQNERFWRLSYATRTQIPVLQSLGTDLEAWTAEILVTLSGYFRAAAWPNPEIEAAILFATIDGIAQHYVLQPKSYPLAAVTELLVDRYRQAPPASAASIQIM